jgi:hypothetical protein
MSSFFPFGSQLEGKVVVNGFSSKALWLVTRMVKSPSGIRHRWSSVSQIDKSYRDRGEADLLCFPSLERNALETTKDTGLIAS